MGEARDGREGGGRRDERKDDAEAVGIAPTEAAPSPRGPTTPPSATGTGTRPSLLAMTTCAKCHTLTPLARFCTECGQSLGARRFCSDCGAPLTPGAALCDACGVQVP